ncbi:putative glycosyl transferase, family 14 [Helianthus anomalus]
MLLVCAAVLRNLADKVAYDSQHPLFQYVAASEDLQADDTVVCVPISLVVMLERVLGNETISKTRFGFCLLVDRIEESLNDWTLKNVVMITKANLVTYRGPTMVANTLHAAAMLLRDGGDWDWFINLSASDYPLVTQDDLIYVFSMLPRDVNFIDHTSNIGWNEFQRAKPVIVDPGLYMSEKSDVFWIT